MKVGRREFLKRFAGAAVGAVAVAVPKGLEPKVVEDSGDHWVTGTVWDEDGVEQIYIDGEGPLSLEEYARRLGIKSNWIFATSDECECPACLAALQEYDCDFYMAISEGGWVEEWTDPLTGVPRYTALGWGDHGLHTVFLADGQYLGEALSAQIDPDEYLRSIWVAGQVALRTMLMDKDKP